MSEAIIDTNILIHAIVEESSKHLEARKLLDKLDLWYIPVIVLYEVVWVLRKLKLTVEQVEKIVDTIAKNPKASIIADDGSDTSKALRILIRENLNLTQFNDKVILSVALRLARPIKTYDDELKQETKNLLTEESPRHLRQ
jgi:predicted nucleic acid-binding protein